MSLLEILYCPHEARFYLFNQDLFTLLTFMIDFLQKCENSRLFTCSNQPLIIVELESWRIFPPLFTAIVVQAPAFSQFFSDLTLISFVIFLAKTLSMATIEQKKTSKFISDLKKSFLAFFSSEITFYQTA